MVCQQLRARLDRAQGRISVGSGPTSVSCGVRRSVSSGRMCRLHDQHAVPVRQDQLQLARRASTFCPLQIASMPIVTSDPSIATTLALNSTSTPSASSGTATGRVNRAK